MSEPVTQSPVTLEISIAWGEMDALQHVNNIVYFRYFESARFAYFQRLGMKEWLDRGLGPILASTTCNFRAPLTFPDTIAVSARTTAIREHAFVMQYGIWSPKLARVAAEGEGVLVTYDYRAGKKIPVPDELRHRIIELEAAAGNRIA